MNDANTQTNHERRRDRVTKTERETDRDSDRALDRQGEGRGGGGVDGEGGGRAGREVTDRGRAEGGGASIDWLIKSMISLHTTERNRHKCLQPLNTKSFSQAEIHGHKKTALARRHLQRFDPGQQTVK